MQTEHQEGTRQRPLRVLRMILDHPYGYTRKQLAQNIGASTDTIKRIFNDFANAGFVMRPDSNNRYAFVEDKPLKQLKSLLHFSEEDQVLLDQAIDQISPLNERATLLKRKLGSLYDYQKLGNTYLRKPYLSKVDALMQAKVEKKVVLLEGYRSSNSNDITNRMVEPFHPSPPDDTVHAYDLDKGKLRHYRISRINRVKILDQPWTKDGHHLIRPTDPFRIVNASQEMVHLRMSVGAYNELVERFPLTKGYLEPSQEEEMFDLQCMVNEAFLGLTNFILGNYHQRIEVLEPDSLRDRLKEMVGKMEF